MPGLDNTRLLMSSPARYTHNNRPHLGSLAATPSTQGVTRLLLENLMSKLGGKASWPGGPPPLFRHHVLPHCGPTISRERF